MSKNVKRATTQSERKREWERGGGAERKKIEKKQSLFGELRTGMRHCQALWRQRCSLGSKPQCCAVASIGSSSHVCMCVCVFVYVCDLAVAIGQEAVSPESRPILRVECQQPLKNKSLLHFFPCIFVLLSSLLLYTLLWHALVSLSQHRSCVFIVRSCCWPVCV